MAAARNCRVLQTIPFLLVVCLIGSPAQAKYGGGTGEPNEPYLIYTAEQMNEIGLHEEDWDKHFKLMANINLSLYTGTDFNIIGTGNSPFTGVFDGNGHTISNFTWSSANGSYVYVGLFAYVADPNAEIKNLGLIDPNIVAGTLDRVGSSLVGNLADGILTNCYVKGGSVSGGSYVGGLVGRNRGTIVSCYSTSIVTGNYDTGGLAGQSGGTITNCYTTGSVISDLWGGGLVGDNDGNLTSCYSTGSVVGNEDIGGLVGCNSGTITSCRSAAKVTGKDNSGGLVGYNVYAIPRLGPPIIGTITSCYSASDVTGRDKVGGLVGYSGGVITNCHASGSVIGEARVGGLIGNNGGTLTNCYSAGNVAGNEYTGGLVGDGSRSRIFESFWDIETSGQPDSAGGEGKTTAQMQMASTFYSWDSCGNVATWTIDEGNDYPRLSWENKAGEAIVAISLSDFLEGNGTENGPYLIHTAQELNLIGLGVCDRDKHFKLMADIDLARYAGEQFNIIGNYWQSPFMGIFDGNGHTIANFSYTCMNRDYVGLFGYVDDPNAEIKNLTLIRTSINIRAGHYVGPLVGYLACGTVTNCCVETCIVSGSNGVGSLVGYNDAGTIANCCAAGTVVGDHSVGGLLGSNSGVIMHCYSTGTVAGYSSAGGLIGYNLGGGTVVNCHSAGVVAGEKETGGLAGGNLGIVINCYSSSPVIGSEVGGLVGSGRANNVIGSFWDIEASGQLDSAGGTGKTMAQMQTADTFFSWGACGNEGVWTIDEGNDYPRLWWEHRPGQIMAAIQLPDLLRGTGTQDTLFLIYTAEELNLIGLYPCEWDGHFRLMADIDLSAYTGDRFNVIGLGNMPFTGVFDGNGHTIANFSYTCPSAAYVGLFGLVDGPNAEIKNLALIDASIDAGSGGFMGSLVGYLSDATITNCSSTGTVSGSNFVGGLVAHSNAGTIDNCYSISTVTGNAWIGGLVGHHSDFGTIVNCYSTSAVTGEGDTGGLVGRNSASVAYCYSIGTIVGNRDTGGLIGYNSGTVSDCYATGTVSGTDHSGGLVGRNYETIANCYASGSVSGETDMGGLIGFNSGDVTGCYSTGSVTGQEDVGGLVGENDWYGAVTSSFWDSQISGVNNMCGSQGRYATGCDDSYGKTTAEMQTESTFTDVGWDFVGESQNGTQDIWCICEGEDYPKLTWQFVIGDFDGNEDADFADFCILAEHWLAADGSFWCGQGCDLTNDGRVNWQDLMVFGQSWLTGADD